MCTYDRCTPIQIKVFLNKQIDEVCYSKMLRDAPFHPFEKKTVGNECFFESDFEAEGQVMRFELKGFPLIFSH